jgi:hypothetical protein
MKEDVQMMKKVLVVLSCLVLAVSFYACKKKEEKPVPQAPFQQAPLGPMQPSPQMPVQSSPQMPIQPAPQMKGVMGKTKVVVPDNVKGKWSAVTIVVIDKITGNSKDYTVNLNSDFKIPNSDLKVHVGDFLPDFKMEGTTLTSASNEPNNPAVGIKVFEKGKQIFPALGKQWGWLFSKMPTVHPLRHPKYNIVLKEGIPKKG